MNRSATQRRKRKARIAAHTGSAKGLNGVVDDAKGGQRRRHLDHGDLGAGMLVAQLVHHVGGFQR